MRINTWAVTQGQTEHGGGRAYIFELADGVQHVRAQLGRKALELAGAVDMLGRFRVLEVANGVRQRGFRRARLELDNVVARDELGAPRLDDGSREGEGEERGQSEELHGADPVECRVGCVYKNEKSGEEEGRIVAERGDADG